MMVFSGLLGSSTTSSSSSHNPRGLLTSPSTTSVDSATHGQEKGQQDAATGPDYIFDDAQLRPPAPEPPDLRELNASLEALAAVFPDIQVEVFREMLSSFDGESRLALVADTLLKKRMDWVKGRWRVVDKDGNPDAADASSSSSKDKGRNAVDGALVEGPLVPESELFRSAEYRKAARRLARHEFKGLSKSTIDAVLAESNYAYLDARRTLVNLSSKSWRFTISSIFLRRKPLTSSEAKDHPLVSWKQPGGTSSPAVPCLKPTGSAELDRELFNELIAPLKRRSRMLQEEEDHSLALTLNNEEAEEMGGTYECACCFTDAAFEEFTSCNAEGHMVCFRCVQHAITEAVFGQGWQPNINKENGTLKCLAVDSSECAGWISSDHIHRAMLEDKNGASVLHKLQQRLAEHSLVSSNLPLVRCPFCDYAEVDDLYVSPRERRLRLRVDNIFNLAIILLCAGTVPFLLPAIVASSFLALLVSSEHTFGDYIVRQFSRSVTRYRRRRRGLKFACQNPECGRTSCIGCGKAWVDIHVCNESALVALRTQVEQAMSMAIKRVCPRCNTSFVKSAGCNKLTCTCGYKMCYVCRKDIGGDGDGPDVGYRHFCDHFRPEGDPKKCAHCNKCNLWESEDTEQVLRQAKEEAERKWRETEKRELSGAERVFLETGVAAQSACLPSSSLSSLPLPSSSSTSSLPSPLSVWGFFYRGGRWPTVAELCDFVVENLLV